MSGLNFLQVPSLSHQLARLTSHHHNHVYLAQHLGFSERSRQLQQQMAFQLLKDALPLGDGGDVENTEKEVRKFKVNSRANFFRAIYLCVLVRGVYTSYSNLAKDYLHFVCFWHRQEHLEVWFEPVGWLYVWSFLLWPI